MAVGGFYSDSFSLYPRCSLDRNLNKLKIERMIDEMEQRNMTQTANELDELLGEVELIEIDETITLSETAASSGISSCNSCSCCASTSCCSSSTIKIT